MLERVPGPVRIAYERVGGGPLIIFLHGVGGSRTLWQNQLEFFGERFCAVAWDARGYGDSDDPPGTLKFSDFADDLNRLLDRLHGEKAHLVGLSMGGLILLDFYSRYPARTATLCLADAMSGFRDLSEEVRRDFAAHRIAPLEAGRTPAELAPAVVDVLLSSKASAQVRERFRTSLAALRPGPYAQALRAITTTDFRSTLARIGAPTLVLVGAEDRLTPPVISDALAAAIPGARKSVIGNAGHLSNLEQPQAFNQALDTFLEPHVRLASAF